MKSCAEVPVAVGKGRGNAEMKLLSVFYRVNGKKYVICSLARDRTWILSSGNSYTIHCTTRPLRNSKGMDFKKIPVS